MDWLAGIAGWLGWAVLAAALLFGGLGVAALLAADRDRDEGDPPDDGL